MPEAGEDHAAPTCPGKHPLCPAPIPHPTRVVPPSFWGLCVHRQQNLAWVEANTSCLRASQRASGMQPQENIYTQIP